MKKLMILIIVLLVVGGVGFYFGWIQIRIPADGYGVIFTRTNGWEDDAVEPGTFVWRWQGLIPTNLSLYVFTPEAHRTSASLSGTLPSGDAIKMILPDAGAFRYEVGVDVQTRLRPQKLPSLARDRELRPGDLSDYYEELDSRISTLAQDALMRLVENDDEALTLSNRHDEVVRAITARIEEQLPEVEVVAVTPRRLDLPDLELYRDAKRLATEVLESRAQSLKDAVERIADTQAQTDSGLSLLERYGEILDRYPVLLEYFKVGQEIDGDPLNLESIVPQTGR
jgi:regulator of protease activity HflC (stomatin/prohibitin superfamily)